jgi:hypothetical protein
MPRLYRVPYTGTITAVGGDTDLIALTPADDKPIALVGMKLSQSSEFGDAQEESVRITLRHMTGTVTITGGTGVTPVKNSPVVDAAAAFTATANSTTVATTTGTSTIAEELAWNERNTPMEMRWDWVNNEALSAVQTEYILVRLESTLADDITGEVTFFVVEYP